MDEPLRSRASFLTSASAALLAGPLRAGIAGAQTVLTPVKFGGSPNDDLTAIVYAQRMGLYQKAGLDVTVEKSSSGSAAAAAVAADAFNIGKSSTSTIFDAHLRGVPFTILGPAADYDSNAPYGGFLFSPGSPFKTGKDAEGQTVGVSSLSSVGRVAFAAWVEQHGGDSKAVKFVEIPFPAVPPALDQQRILAGETTQPTQEAAISKGYRFVPIFSAIALHFSGSIIYTTKTFSSTHPDAVRTFMKVTYESARICNANPAGTLQMMSDFTGVPLAVMQKTPRVQLGTELVVAQVQSLIDAAAKYGALLRGFAARELVDANVSYR
jgi:NitT/TauT family transport system substrate-binding protein